MYLKVSSNNRARTVLSAFNSAVQEYGLPFRIRIDRGGENVLVGQMLLEHPERGMGRSSVLVGQSVHNQCLKDYGVIFTQVVYAFFTICFTFLRTSMCWM